MRNRLYGGVRGQVNTKEVNTSISVHLLLDSLHELITSIDAMRIKKGVFDIVDLVFFHKFRPRRTPFKKCIDELRNVLTNN